MKKIVSKVKSLLVIGSFTSLSIFLMSSLPVVASSKDQILNGYNDAGGNTASVTSMSSVIGKVINTMLFIVGVLAVAMIIYSGIRYITAHGDKSQVESAKNTLIYSVVGLIVAILAYAIVNWVLNLF